MNNTEMKVQLLEALIKKGFTYRLYEEQGIHFYTLVIDSPEFIESKVQQHYGWTVSDDTIDLTGVKFLIEVQMDLSTAQWSFVDGLDQFYIFEDNNEFLEYIETLPDKLQLV